MRERVRELGGTLEIQSNGNGTTVTAVIPETTAAAVGISQWMIDLYVLLRI